MKVIRARSTPVGIDMSPLIDCVFQLLIFFLLSSSFLAPTMKIRLPSASSGTMQDAGEIHLSMDEEGKLFVNALPTTLADLPRDLGRLLAVSQSKIVIFRGDEAAGYGVFVKALDIARSAGAQQILIAHRPATDD